MRRIDTTDDSAYLGTRTLLSPSHPEREYDLTDKFRIHLGGMYFAEIGPEWSSGGKQQGDFLHHIDIGVSGRRQVVCDGRVYDLEPGQIWFLPGNTPVERRCRENCEVVFFKVSCEWLPGVDPLLEWQQRGPRLAGTCKVKEWRDWAALGRPMGAAEILQLRGHVLLWIAAAVPELGTIVSHHLEMNIQFTDAFTVLEEQLGADLRLAQLAKACGTTIGAFSMAFTRNMGISPKNYIIRRLNQQALHWVTNTELKMKEISIKLRFEDEFYFSRFFKKLNGCSPRAYRQRFRRAPC